MPSLGLCANISRVTVFPLTAPVTVRVPVVVPSAQFSEMLTIVWVPLSTAARAPLVSGLPIVPNPIKARPPIAIAMPASRAATLRPTRTRTARLIHSATVAARSVRYRIPRPLISRRPPTASDPSICPSRRHGTVTEISPSAPYNATEPSRMDNRVVARAPRRGPVPRRCRGVSAPGAQDQTHLTRLLVQTARSGRQRFRHHLEGGTRDPPL